MNSSFACKDKKAMEDLQQRVHGRIIWLDLSHAECLCYFLQLLQLPSNFVVFSWILITTHDSCLLLLVLLYRTQLHIA